MKIMKTAQYRKYVLSWIFLLNINNPWLHKKVHKKREMGNNWEWIWTFSWSFPLSNLFLSLNLSSFPTNTKYCRPSIYYVIWTGFRKWAFLLTQHCIYADIVGGSQKSPKMCWRNIWMVPYGKCPSKYYVVASVFLA